MGEGDECEVPAVAVRWYSDDPQPGLAEVELTDRHGTVHRLIGKNVYFGYHERLMPDVEYPVAVTVCVRVAAVDGDTLTVQALDFFDDDGDAGGDGYGPFTVEVDASAVRPETVFAAGDECALPATAVCWLTDEPQPGLVLAELWDARHRPHQVVGKPAHFGGPWKLTPTTRYPLPISLTCTVENIEDGIATVRTHGLSNRFGSAFVFDVREWELRDTDF